MSPLAGENSNHTSTTCPLAAVVPIPFQGLLGRSRILMMLLITMLLQTSAGCQFPSMTTGPRLIDQVFVNYRDRVWAQRAYNMEYGDRILPFRDHFRRGYIEGYCAVCRGGDGYVPAMPPQEYWSYEYQSPEGAECVNSWFEGYPAGAMAAKSRGIDKYHDVYISRMVDAAIQQEKTGVKLPSDLANAAPQNSAPPKIEPVGSGRANVEQARESVLNPRVVDQSSAGFEKFNHLFQDQ